MDKVCSLFVSLVERPIIGAVGDQNSGEGQGQSGMGPCYKVQSSTSYYWRGQAGTWQVTGWSLLLLSLLSGFGQGTEQTNPRKLEHEGSHVPGAELSLELGRTTSNPVLATIVRRVEPPPNTLLHKGRKVRKRLKDLGRGCPSCIDGVRKEGEIASCFRVPLWVRIPLSQKKKKKK